MDGSIRAEAKEKTGKGKNKGLVEEEGWRKKGKMVGSPMQKQETEQRQVSTHGCIPGRFLQPHAPYRRAGLKEGRHLP